MLKGIGLKGGERCPTSAAMTRLAHTRRKGIRHGLACGPAVVDSTRIGVNEVVAGGEPAWVIGGLRLAARH